MILKRTNKKVKQLSSRLISHLFVCSTNNKIVLRFKNKLIYTSYRFENGIQSIELKKYIRFGIKLSHLNAEDDKKSHFFAFLSLTFCFIALM